MYAHITKIAAKPWFHKTAHVAIEWLSRRVENFMNDVGSCIAGRLAGLRLALQLLFFLAMIAFPIKFLPIRIVWLTDCELGLKCEWTERERFPQRIVIGRSGFAASRSRWLSLCSGRGFGLAFRRPGKHLIHPNGTTWLCTKTGNSDLFSLRPLRISAALCVERPINAENAEIRRGPQRKDFYLNSTFCAKPNDVASLKSPASAFETSKLRQKIRPHVNYVRSGDHARPLLTEAALSLSLSRVSRASVVSNEKI